MNNLANDQLLEKQKKQEMQINADPQQINAEPQQLNAQQQLNDQQQLNAQQQSAVQLNAQQQLPVVIPDAGAQLDEAYAAVRGKQRMSKKEREKRVDAFNSKKALSDRVASGDREYNEKRLAAAQATESVRGPEQNFERGGLAWLDDSGSAEATEKNKTRMSRLTGSDRQAQLAEANAIFDEFLKMDISDLAVGTDTQLAENVQTRRQKQLRAMEIEQFINAFDAMGVPIEEERRVQLIAKKNAVIAIDNRADAYLNIIGSPYYALLRKEDTAKFTPSQLERRIMKAAENNNKALADYYTNLMLLRGKSDYKRGQTVDSIYEKELAKTRKRRAEELKTEKSQSQDREAAEMNELNKDAAELKLVQERERHEAALKRKGATPEAYVAQRDAIDTLYKDVVKYPNNDPLVIKTKNPALTKSGITNRHATRKSVVLGIFFSRSGKKVGDPLTPEDKEQIKNIQAEVDNIVVNENTEENGGKLLLEMGRGLLSMLPTNYPIDTETKLRKNLAPLQAIINIEADFLQLYSDNKSCADVMFRQLSNRDIERLCDFDAFYKMYGTALSDYSKMIGDPKYAAYVHGGQLTDDEKEDFEKLKASTAFLQQNAPLLAKISRQKDFRMKDCPQASYEVTKGKVIDRLDGIASNLTKEQIRQNELADQQGVKGYFDSSKQIAKDQIAKKAAWQKAQLAGPKGKLSDMAQRQLKDYDTKTKAAFKKAGDLGQSQGDLRRSLAPWLDLSGTPEAEQKNRQMLDKFRSEDKTVRYAAYNDIFDQFLAMDINKLKVGTDADFVKHLEEYTAFVRRGFQIKLTLTKAKIDGMTVDPEREKQILARGDLFECANNFAGGLSKLISNRNYALLDEKVNMKLDQAELTKRMTNAAHDGEMDVFNYYNGIAELQNARDFTRESDPKAVLDKFYADRTAKAAKEQQNSAGASQGSK